MLYAGRIRIFSQLITTPFSFRYADVQIDDSTFFFSFYWNSHLFETQTYKEGGTEIERCLISIGSHPEWPQWPGLGKTKVKNPQLHQRLPHVCRRPSTLTILCCSPRFTSWTRSRAAGLGPNQCLYGMLHVRNWLYPMYQNASTFFCVFSNKLDKTTKEFQHFLTYNISKNKKEKLH